MHQNFNSMSNRPCWSPRSYIQRCVASMEVEFRTFELESECRSGKAKTNLLFYRECSWRSERLSHLCKGPIASLVAELRLGPVIWVHDTILSLPRPVRTCTLGSHYYSARRCTLWLWTYLELPKIVPVIPKHPKKLSPNIQKSWVFRYIKSLSALLNS